MTETTTQERLPRERPALDEVMLAMDVVDTLRHRELVVARELGAEDRDRELKERLREIYTGQGLVVSDAILEEGVRALREDRFVYAGAEPSFGRTLATLYVTRNRWGKPVAAAIGLVAVALVSYQLFVRGPALRAIEALPTELVAAEQRIDALSDDPQALAEAAMLAAQGRAALGGGDTDAAQAAVAQLNGLHAKLDSQYELRIVSRPGELTGFWREPEDNPAAQNFYLVVEAVTPDGDRLTLPIANEEDGRVRDVSKWAVRVDGATYERVVADKRADGIVNDAVVGAKARGRLDVDYRMTATGGTITEW